MIIGGDRVKKTVKKNTSKKGKNESRELDRKGFTLIELLAVIAVLALVMSITMYSITSLVRNAKEKTYATTINEIETAAGNFSLENSDEIFFIQNTAKPGSEYQCIMIQNLIDYGYLDNNVIKANVSDDVTVNPKAYVYLERNIQNKTITQKKYVLEGNSICGNAIAAEGYIVFASNPKDWSREKQVNITYKLKNIYNKEDRKNFEFLYYFIYKDNGSMGPSNYNVGNTSTSFTVSKEGTVYANVWDIKEDTTFIFPEPMYNVGKFDTKGPVISLVNSNSEKKYVSNQVDIPIMIRDFKHTSENGGDCAVEGKDCSGVADITTSAELKNQIVDTGKLKVSVNDKEVDKSKISLSYISKGKYNINVKSGENGPIKIVFLEGAFGDNNVPEQRNYNDYTPLNPNIVFDNEGLQISVSNTSDAFVTEQTATLTCSDNNSGIKYYIGSSKPTSSTTFSSDIENVFDSSLGKSGQYVVVKTKKVTSVGTLYFACKDVSNHISTIAINYWNYTVKGLQNKVAEDEEVYNLTHYSQYASNSFLGSDGMRISFTDLLYSNESAQNYILDGSSFGTYKGYSKGNPSSNGNAEVFFEPVILNSNMTYCLWFDRNKVNIIYNTNGGTLISTHEALSKQDNDDIVHSSKEYLTSIKYGGRLDDGGLINWNNSDYVNIKKEGFMAVKGSEWKCKSGCTTANKTFTHDGIQGGKDPQYAASEFCNAKNDSCNVVLMVNWNNIRYDVEFNLKGGKSSNKDFSDINYTDTYRIYAPWKKVKIVSKTNSALHPKCSNPTITPSSNMEASLDYNWYADGANMGKITSFNGSIFNDIKDGGTGFLTSHWSLKSGDKLVMPTIKRTGCVCGWGIKDGTDELKYESGAEYTDYFDTDASTTDGYISINVYPVCTNELPDPIDDDRCYYNHKDTSDKKNGTFYHITTCDTVDTPDAKCNYTEANGISMLGLVSRANLNEKDSSYCKYSVTYDCKTNGGSTADTTKQYKWSQKPSLDFSCTKDGWEFLGWNTNKNGRVALNESNIKKGNQTLYAIYKMQFKTMFYGEGFGLSYPSGINFNDFIGVSFGCTDENKKPCTSNCDACSSTCIIYNNDLVLTISPDIVNTKKTFFAQSKNPVSTFDSSIHVKENKVFTSTLVKTNSNIRYYFVPHDPINARRYRCQDIHDGDGTWRRRLDVYNISTCDGINCKFTAHNGISENSTVIRGPLSSGIGSGCKSDYYLTSSVNCYPGAKASGTPQTVAGCKKITLARTTTKIKTNGSSSWYYYPDKNCYIDDSKLSASYPSSCNANTGTGTSGSCNGKCVVYVNTNGGHCYGSDSYGNSCTGSSGYVAIYYSSTYPISSLNSLVRHDHCKSASSVSGNGRTYYSNFNASDNGRSFTMNWNCDPGKACYKCRDSYRDKIEYKWYTAGAQPGYCSPVDKSYCP